MDVAAASRKCSQYLRRRSICRQEQVRPVENKSSGRQADMGVIRSGRGTNAPTNKPQVSGFSLRWRQRCFERVGPNEFSLRPLCSIAPFSIRISSSMNVSFESPINLEFRAI